MWYTIKNIGLFPTCILDANLKRLKCGILPSVGNFNSLLPRKLDLNQADTAYLVQLA